MFWTSSARLLVLLALSIAFSACQRHDSPADIAKIKVALLTAADIFPMAFYERNAEAVAALYTEDARLLPPGGPMILGRAAIRDYYAREIANNEPLLMIVTEDSGVAGDWAWRSGTWMTHTTPHKWGKFLQILKRTPDGWRRHRDMWNDDPPPNVPADTAAASTQ